MATTKVSAAMMRAMISIASLSGAWEVGTARALRARGLSEFGSAPGRPFVTVLTDAGYAMFEGRTFAVVYTVKIDKVYHVRVWTGGIDLRGANREMCDLLEVGIDDPDFVQGTIRVVPQESVEIEVSRTWS